MDFKFSDIKELLEINLRPITDDIKELKADQKELRDDQKKIIEIISVQSQHTLLIDDLKGHIKECKEDRMRMDADRQSIKDKSNNRLWEATKYLVAVVVGGLINHFSIK